MECVANYMWNMKPNESKPIPTTCIESNKRIFNQCNVIHPDEITALAMNTPKLQDLWGSIPHWIIKADLGRLLYIYTYGNFYLDVDCQIAPKFQTVQVNKMILFIEKIVNSVNELGPRECKNPMNALRVANYAFGTTTRNHPFLKEVIDECITRLQWLVESNTTPSELDILWVCGPDVITTVYHRSKNNYSDIVLLDTSYASHFCYGSWRGPA